MKKICVFCGSSDQVSKKFKDNAYSLGQDMATHKIGLVYGGASIGVMGAVAEGCLSNDGEVLGVIPQSIVDLEVAHEGLSELFIVGSMHERKEKMYELSHGFFALPGGWGTLDELCEIVTWSQLNYHHKPIYLVNEGGFFDYFIKHLEHVCSSGFMRKEHLDLVKVFKTADEALLDFAKRY